MNNTKIRLQRSNFGRDIELLIQHDGAVVKPEGLIFTQQPECEYSLPTATITILAAQVLIDDLWAAGLRPTEGSGSAGSLKATEKHLNDMRSIVEKELDINFK